LPGLKVLEQFFDAMKAPQQPMVAVFYRFANAEHAQGTVVNAYDSQRHDREPGRWHREEGRTGKDHLSV